MYFQHNFLFPAGKCARTFQNIVVRCSKSFPEVRIRCDSVGLVFVVANLCTTSLGASYFCVICAQEVVTSINLMSLLMCMVGLFINLMQAGGWFK